MMSLIKVHSTVMCINQKPIAGHGQNKTVTDRWRLLQGPVTTLVYMYVKKVVMLEFTFKLENNGSTNGLSF